MTKGEFFKTAAIAALAIAFLCAMPAWISWIFNYAINEYVTFFYQLAVIFTIQYVYGKRVAALDMTENGYSFGQAFKFPLTVSAFAGLFAALLAWLLTHVIAPEIAVNAINKITQTIEDEGITNQDIIDNMMSTANFLISFAGILLINVLSMMIAGGIVGLITAGILQRKPEM